MRDRIEREMFAGFHEWTGTVAALLTVSAVVGAGLGVWLLYSFMANEHLHGPTVQMLLAASLFGAVAVSVAGMSALVLPAPLANGKLAEAQKAAWVSITNRLPARFEFHLAAHVPGIVITYSLLAWLAGRPDDADVAILSVLSAMAVAWSVLAIRRNASFANLWSFFDTLNMSILWSFFSILTFFIAAIATDNHMSVANSVRLSFAISLLLGFLLVLPRPRRIIYVIFAVCSFFWINSLLVVGAGTFSKGMVNSLKLGGHEGTFSLAADAYRLLPPELRAVPEDGDPTSNTTKPLCVVLRMADMVYVRPVEAYGPGCQSRDGGEAGERAYGRLLAFKEDQVIAVGRPDQSKPADGK